VVTQIHAANRVVLVAILLRIAVTDFHHVMTAAAPLAVKDNHTIVLVTPPNVAPQIRVLAQPQAILRVQPASVVQAAPFRWAVDTMETQTETGNI
jgi:hypothetical protein